MRRPIFFFAAAFGTGILGAFKLSGSIIVWLMLLTIAAIFFVYFKLYKKCACSNEIWFLICVFSLGGIWFCLTDLQIDPLDGQTGQSVAIAGTVADVSFKEDSCTMVLNCDRNKFLIKCFGDCSYLQHSSGKRAIVYGTVDLLQGRRNPKCFDYRLYLKSCGINTVITAERVEIQESGGSFYISHIASLKNRFEERLLKAVDKENAGLIMAIMFGDKEFMDEQLYEEFRENGTAHILAVSGLHTGIVYAFVVFLWRAKKGIVFYIITSTVLLLYMTLSDFTPSVVRATCMIFLHLIAGITRSRYDLLSAASFTFIIMLIYEPYQLFHIGFQLSFLAIIAIAVLIPFLSRMYNGKFLTVIAVQAGMVPYTAFSFNYVSVGAVFANLPVIFMAGIVLPLGLCALLLMHIQRGMFEFFVQVIDVGCDIILIINEIFYASGRSSFEVVSPGIGSLVMYYGILFFCMSELGQILIMRREKKKILFFSILLIMASLISAFAFASPLKGCEVTFVDVGQGDCIHVRTDSGKNYLIDGGGKAGYDVGEKVLKPYLLKNGVRKIDAAFVTHLHEDHYGGIKSLSVNGMIEKMFLYEGNSYIEEDIQNEISSELIYIKKGDRIKLDDNVYVDVIWPGSITRTEYDNIEEDDENAVSLIMKLSCEGVSVLITGDIDADGESVLMDNCRKALKCDIIKVPHHGSRYSSSEEFIEAADPDYAVFQTGKNNYGHPSEETIERYRKKGCHIVRNDLEGAIGVKINSEGGIMEVIKMIN